MIKVSNLKSKQKGNPHASYYQPVHQLHRSESTYYIDPELEIRDGKPVKYVFRGSRRVAKIEDVTGTACQQTVLLQPGWNFVPVELEPDSIEQILGAAITNVVKVYGFDATAQTHLSYDPQSSSNALTELHEGQAYLIFAQALTQFTIEGSASNTTRDLQQGWNLVASNVQGQVNISEALWQRITLTDAKDDLYL